MPRGESNVDDISARDIIYIMGNNVENWPRLYRDLAKCEQEQVDRFVFEKDKARYTVSHRFMRRILVDNLGCTGSELAFSQGRYGKPYLSGQTGLFFNLSHSDDCSALMVSRYGEVGIDVESPSRMSVSEIESLKFAVLTNAERKSLARLPADQKSEGFMRYWTLKEAYLKQKGWGLYYDLAKLSISIDEPIAVEVAGEKDRDIKLGCTQPLGHTVSWATLNNAAPLFRHLEWPM
ncbi:4'-phosphopantetheinyl transferase superfamily protein [Photobacterium sp. ZSDE20]|uniref:4'-phosphopantetheinyl transferase superfamily protein n=1 Tax=Photobacterium pectinilyticum TaxID=2906793 RepID=A0ABT1N8K8_9GAMM|nr:4'-phosphopantetheinyl transferase superfamily protein [Photobacterium sp. ZSDE20]MCQ1061099.1 4'-phosphopantetheinyl transferase superfamily protein [Photobacterium sp. ZSDE20]MDD1829217.1 4'-phosphopantetheinyl transferase superfamily protein [Photobacterium sp. ZSDE20]